MGFQFFYFVFFKKNKSVRRIIISRHGVFSTLDLNYMLFLLKYLKDKRS